MPMYYMISDMLRESTLNKCLKGDSPYVGVISTQDWIETRDKTPKKSANKKTQKGAPSVIAIRRKG